MHLIASDWFVVYLWLRDGDEFTDHAVTALVDCHYEALANKADLYRVYDYDGCLRYVNRPCSTGMTVAKTNRQTGPFCRNFKQTLPWTNPIHSPPDSAGPWPMELPDKR